MTAFCPKHEDCRKNRTVREFAGGGRAVAPGTARAGQGRPVGLLMAWLRAADEYGDMEAHTAPMVTEMLTRGARRQAREIFKARPGAEEFLSHERPRRDGEDDEPLEIR